MGLRIGLLALILPLIYPVFFVFVFRLLKICVTIFFTTYLLLFIYSSALLKQGSGAIVRFSDSSSFILFCFLLIHYTAIQWNALCNLLLLRQFFIIDKQTKCCMLLDLHP